jgi:D-glycero-beta-D-manno-heptose-7-phosphate kinase
MTSATSQRTDERSRQQRLMHLIGQLPGARVGVIGDLVCDIYVTGLTDRVSREAPVLIIQQEKEWVVPGCAANTAVNLASLGAQVRLVGILGDDTTADALCKKLRETGVATDDLVQAAERHTISKTRFLAGARHTSRQQVLRLDRQPDRPPEDGLRQRLLQRFRELTSEVDAWIINDYGYESFDEALRDALADAAVHKPVVADSRYGLMDFKGVTVAKPNEQEALAVAGTDNIPAAARLIRDRLNVHAVLVTLGNQGMLLHRETTSERIPAAGTDEIVDLTGAGDTVAAVLTAALARNAELSDAAHLANLAGGLVVMKEGAASVTCDELRNALQRGK